ncbi:MAG TPA: galactokinase [Cytophagaceae bacterium]|jgi:galactokinase|nr:galactokinase [Cytophagaceae bacterium]
MGNIEILKEKFEEAFHTKDNLRFFFAPGRVNIIGEHIDYNGGKVFPASLSIGISAVVSLNNSDTVCIRSLNLPGEVQFNLKEGIEISENSWGNYPKGVMNYLIKEGYKLSGCNILFSGNLPDGAGLSSSAALEVLTSYMMITFTNKEPDKLWIAKFCQKVENEFIKVNCGIMDSFSIAMGKKDSAILLDCNSLEYEYVPFDLEDYQLVIMNTNKKRALIESRYNERRKECESILSILTNSIKISTICEASLEQIEKYITDEVLIKRAKHVITENKRVFDVVNALKRKDLQTLGLLLHQSHLSLKNDYEVTGFELDTIVEEAMKYSECLGARMTGAGFGGCAIALVKNSEIDSFKKEVSLGYKSRTGLVASFYESKIGEGVHEHILTVSDTPLQRSLF